MADFKYISSEWDCAEQLLRVKHVGDDTNVVISINNLLTTGLLYVLTRVSKGVFKPSSKVTVGLYEVTYQGSLHDEVISVCDSMCTKAVQALPSEITFNWKVIHDPNNPWRIEKQYKLHINNKHPVNKSEYNEIHVYYIQNICYEKRQKDRNNIFIIELDDPRNGFILWKACDNTIYMRSFIVHKITKCVYSYTPLLKMQKNDYNLVVTYDNNRGIDYRWNILPGASDLTDLPPKGTKLYEGYHCFRIKDTNSIYDPDWACLIISDPGSKLADPLECSFNFGSEVIVTQDPASCSITVQNNTSEIVTFAHYQLSSSDGSCFGEKTLLLKGFTLNPFASIVLKNYPNVYDTLLWAIYKDKCIAEMCLQRCFSKTD